MSPACPVSIFPKDGTQPPAEILKVLEFLKVARFQENRRTPLHPMRNKLRWKPVSVRLNISLLDEEIRFIAEESGQGGNFDKAAAVMLREGIYLARLRAGKL